MKICYSRIQTVFLVATAAILTLALTKQAFGSNLPQEIISQDIAAQNNHDINSFLSLRPSGTDFPEDRSVYQNIWRTNPQDNFIYNIISAKLVGEKAISLDVAEKVTNIESYLQEDSVVKAFYVAIDYSVKVETKYLYNGTNYRFYVLVLDHGKYFIAEASSAPVPLLGSLGFGFGTTTERKVSSLQSQALKSGVLELPNGNIVSRVTAYTQPPTIRVYITQSGTISIVNFADYVKNVLPKEWLTYWSAAALQTGAIAVKMYGWYRTIYPHQPALGFDVYDSPRYDQWYVAGSAQAVTNSAVDAVSGVGFAQSDGSIFMPQYWNGVSQVYGTGGVGLRVRPTPDTTGKPLTVLSDGASLIVVSSGLNTADGYRWWRVKVGNTSNWQSGIEGYVVGNYVRSYPGLENINNLPGQMTQYGTEFLGEEGESYSQMVPYYYNGSPNANYENVNLFTYTPPSSFSASITGLKISPSQVNPGNAFTISYTVNATSAGYVILGASILDSAGTGSWISDSPHDPKVSLNSGINTVSRQFTVPSSISPVGPYDLLAALWLDVNNNGVIDPGVDQSLDSKLYTSLLTILPSAVQVTVTTNPGGRSFSVDGYGYNSTQVFSWTPGSSHTIATTSPQSGSSGTQYVWSNWSDNGTISHSVSPTSNTTYTANFQTQYYLTMNAGAGGSVSPSSSWYNSAQNVSISATPNNGFSFSGWTGSGTGAYTGSNNPASVTMNGPIAESAAFTLVSTAGVLSVSPADGLTSSGLQGGPFSPPSKAYTLTNTGGSSINWSASKSQLWISLSSTSGTLSTGSNTTVTVSINNNANNLSAGTYSDNISFSNTTNGNGNTSRGVTLSVSSSQTRPSWYYTNTGISHVILIPMSSNPNIDGVPLSNGDYIGVFYDSLGTLACGGYVIWNGSSNVSLTAWGNDQSASNPDGFASGETFKWKIWRASDQRTFDATATYSTSASFTNTDKFAANGISGLTKLSATSIAQQQITLNTGWQIISSYISPIYLSMDSVFKQIKSDIIIVKNGFGNVYWPTGGVNSIVNWQSSQGYQIKMQSGGTLTVSGNLITPESTPVSIPKGWSIIGYLRNAPMAIDAALNSISGKVIMVKNGTGLVYWPSQNVNSIGDMNPGEGYQIKMSDSATLVYPANIGSTSALRKIASGYEISPSHHFGVPEVTDNSAVILFPANVVGNVLRPGDEIGIFDNRGKLCGSGVYEDKNLAITVFGDDNLSKEKDGFVPGEQFLVKIYSQTLATEFNYVKVRYLNGDGTYQVNGINIVSSLNVDSYKFKGNAELEVLSNYPNPFNPTTTIAYNLQKTQVIRISLYNILGQLVSTLVNGVQSEGVHQLEINGTQLPSGVYEVVFQTGSAYKTIKIELVK